MCFGVLEALERTRAVVHPENVTVLGELVHNDQVATELDTRGFHHQPETDRESTPATPTVLVTAHGISERRRASLVRSGKTLMDTTCPLVRRAHDAAIELAGEGRHVLVIGKRGHVEVQGIVEDLDRFTVLESRSDVEGYGSDRLGVICQTTTRPELSEEILAEIRRCNPDADIRTIDTICQPTRDRQDAVDHLVARVDVLVVVGGRSSNNSRQLVTRSIARGCPAHLVQTAADIEVEWFSGSDLVGLTAGTSTPPDTIEEVDEALREL
jgi:4-hydroxy-3-methylbut-2-enyl diphosphate reductase